MYISYNWLQNYLPTLQQININELTDKISSSLAEVEQVIEKGNGLNKIIVGEIKTVAEHPKSNKHMIANVNTGKDENQIIFAAANQAYVKPGDLYPICLPGGSIYNAKDPFGKQTLVEINIREIEGEISEGILCSPKELGVIDDEKGISIIGDNLSAGEDLTYFLKDFVFEVENKSLTHRPDCFSHRGLAREIAAIMNIEFLEKAESKTPVITGDKPLEVSVLEKKLCRRFTAITIQNITVKPSPAWMQIALSYVGTRPINNIVDISNYIMFDIGYPTHIYDYDKIFDHKLTVRLANNGEKVKGLNEKEYELDNTMVVISDTKNVENIAGTMGGANSEITENTKNIIIESAAWDMFNIRTTSMKLGLTSEASVRFSKGLDSFGTKETIQIASELVEDLAGGEISSNIIDKVNEPHEVKTINFDLNMIRRLLGIEISKEESIRILESLNINVEGQENISHSISENTTNFPLKLTIPYYRKDLNIPQDVIEEIARINGYGKIEPKLPQRSIKSPQTNTDSRFIRKLRQFLTESGMDELLTYTFVGKELYEKCNLKHNSVLKLKNPLSPELELLRNHLLPSILEKIEINMNNFDTNSFFEISRVILRDKKDDIPNQSRKIAALVSSKSNLDTFIVLKEKLNYLFSKLGLNAQYINLNADNAEEITSLFHPYKSARILINNKEIGYIGEIHPLVSSNFKYTNLGISLSQLNYNSLKELAEDVKFEYVPICYTQKVERDISINLEEKSEIQPIIDVIKSSKVAFLNSIDTIDIYSDKEGNRSVTLRFTLQDKEKTLNDKDIKLAIDSITEVIEQKLKLKLKK